MVKPFQASRTFSLPELEKHWGTTKERLEELMIAGTLVPSFVINHVARKVRFKWVVNEDEEGGGHWEPSVTGELVEADDGTMRHTLSDVDGEYYLLHPERTGHRACTYYYLSKNREHTKGEEDSNICFMLTLNKRGPFNMGVTLSMAYQQGFIRAEEVERFERIWMTQGCKASSDKSCSVNKTTDFGDLKEMLSAVEIDEERMRRSVFASQGGRAAAAKRDPAKKYVQERWDAEFESYEGNKSEFARTYVRLVMQEFGIEVTEKTLKESWLRNPSASK